MEGWLIIGGIIGIITLWTWIASLVEKRRQGIRDEVAMEVLGGQDIDSVITQYREKLHYIGYTNYDVPIAIRSYFPPEQPKPKEVGAAEDNLFGRCEECNDGHLKVNKSRYGQVLLCSNYPRCRNIRKYSHVKNAYKQGISDKFTEDLQRAYSNC